MSHLEQQQFVKFISTVFPDFFAEKKVLEIGSLDINGSVRQFFLDCEYHGVDLEPGPGVDHVGQGQDIDFADDYFDTVISTECFEHNPFWRETFRNMVRMSNGLVVVTAASCGRPEHGTSKASPESSPFTVKTWDYYKNISVEDFLGVLDFGKAFLHYDFSIDARNRDFQFWGIVNNNDKHQRNLWHVEQFKRTGSLSAQFRDYYTFDTWNEQLSKIFGDLNLMISKLDQSLTQTTFWSASDREQFLVQEEKIMNLSKEIKELRNSNIWRLTKPYRVLRERFRL